jgi:Stress responsive A/B Barrel Domain
MQIKHVVLLKVATGIPAEEVEQALQGLASLVGRIPGLLDYSGGANNSPESKARGFTHGFVMTFADAASRDAYLPHALHVQAAQRLDSILESGDDAVLVLDWPHQG